MAHFITTAKNEHLPGDTLLNFEINGRNTQNSFTAFNVKAFKKKKIF